MRFLERLESERRALPEMKIFHAHSRTRMRAQGILQLSQGLFGYTAGSCSGHLMGTVLK